MPQNQSKGAEQLIVLSSAVSFAHRRNEIVRQIVAEIERPLTWRWWFLWLLAWGVAVWGLGWSTWRIATEGVGVLGVNNQVPWGLDIAHFVFWIGLGHAGTLISAVLLLTSQHWRSPIARGAELMTLCAVVCAAIFPLVHVGRIWMAWMILPVPEVSGVWQNLMSPLIWDVLAICTYLLLSVGYWYLGLIPDLAVVRDHARSRTRKVMYGAFALGWMGTLRQWRGYLRASILLAVVLTPLVISVHSVVSFDFAVTYMQGWHETIFPPYFVAGALLSGMAMVQILMVVVRLLLGRVVHSSITKEVMGRTSRLVLAFSLMMALMYFWEWGTHAMQTRDWSVAHWWEFFPAQMAIFNVLIPQLYWFQRVRRSWCLVPLVAMGVLWGMWCERWQIVVHSLEQSLLPALQQTYVPSATDWAMGAGSVGLFLALYMLFVRFTPFFSIGEVVRYLQDNEPEEEVGLVDSNKIGGRVR